MKFKKIIKIVAISILIIIFILSIIYIIKYFIDKSKRINTDEIIKNLDIKLDESKITDELTSDILKLEELQKKNSDIVALIKIDGTSIDYPVLQTVDNTYYLTHNYNKENVMGGAIFLDKDVSLTLPSVNFLVYGHRMDDGTMFEDLIKYTDEVFYNEHKTIKFVTNNEEAEYQIMAIFYSKIYYKSDKDVFRYYYFVNAKNEVEFNNYVENCIKASIYDTGVVANYGEQLLTLSTCEYSRKDGRFVVVAKKKYSSRRDYGNNCS